MSHKTMYQPSNSTIRIEDVAAKLEAAEQDADPRLRDQMAANPRQREALLFLWKMGLSTGGLGKLAEEFLAQFPDRIGTPTMGKAKSDNYTLAEKLAIYAEMPGRYRPQVKLGRDNVWGEIISDLMVKEVADMDARDRKVLESALDEMHPETFREICRKAAREKLPGYFAALCTQKGKGFGPSHFQDEDCTSDLLERESGIWSNATEVWYFQDVFGALVGFMDRWSLKLKGRLAMTAVTRQVFETVDEVLETREPRFLRGDSRFGKTESLKLKAEMHPGRLVFIPVPRGNSLRDLQNNIAESLGIDKSYGPDLWTLGSRIRYIFNWTGLVPLFDEGAWLVPASYSKTTTPDRLDWVRSELFERGVPAVIAVTPQWYDESLSKFIAKTRYAAEQFTGRCLAVELPGTLDLGDLVRVAAHHFPEFKRKGDLIEIAAVAPQADGFLKAVEQISKHARYMAKRGAVPLTMELVRKAIVECYPKRHASAQRTAAQCPGAAQIDSQEAAPRATRPAARRRVNEPLKPVARGLQPAGMDTELEGAFDSKALRGAGLERVETDLVPVEA